MMHEYLKTFKELYDHPVIITSNRKQNKSDGWVMSLGDFIVYTEDLKTHKRLRNIGDKSFTQLTEMVFGMEEYHKLKGLLGELR